MKKYSLDTCFYRVDSKFLKFLPKYIFLLPLLKKGAKTLFFRFLKNTVPCEFFLLKLYNFNILYLISFLFMIKKSIFTKNYPGTKLRGWPAPSLKVNLAENFTSEFMLTDSTKFFDALAESLCLSKTRFCNNFQYIYHLFTNLYINSVFTWKVNVHVTFPISPKMYRAST